MATGRSIGGKITKAIKGILIVVAVIAVLCFIFLMLFFRDGNKGKHRFHGNSIYF